MSIIKEKIRFTGNDIRLKLPVSTDNNITGNQQEINNFVTGKSNSSINDPIDQEVKRFKYVNQNDQLTLITFRFYSQTEQEHWNSYDYAGFTDDEINRNDLNFLNSFYILEFFDDYNPLNQTRILTTYMGNLNENLYYGSTLSVYSLVKENQIFYLNVPLSFIESNKDKTYFNGFGRISFYNAKTGKIIPFYNRDYVNYTTPIKQYFRIRLSFSDKSWLIYTSSLTPPPGDDKGRLFLYELETSPEYTERINNTVQNFSHLEQVYPTGSTFNYEDIEYI